MTKLTPGDGRALPPYRWWQMFSRSLLHVRVVDAGVEQIWSIDVKLGGDENGEVFVDAYRNGMHHSRAKPPARFAVPGGTIEVATSGYGLKRAHYVVADGSARQLTPDPASAEGRRARLDSTAPALSRAIGVASIVVLVVAFVLGIPQIIETVTSIPPIADTVGTFVSPIRLPAWLNTGLIVGALAASTERALRFRYNRILDGGFFDGEE